MFIFDGDIILIKFFKNKNVFVLFEEEVVKKVIKEIMINMKCLYIV